MANQALAILENALRARKLDRTLTTALPPLAPESAGRAPAEIASSPTGIAALDACLRPSTGAQGAPGSVEGRGGVPRGQLSEIAGQPSSGRTTLLLQTIASATERGDIAAVVDTLDRLDVASVVAAGVDLDRLLWIRGHAHGGALLVDQAIDRALKALNLVLQSGGFGLVAIDLADVPAIALRRIPFTTWLRVQRTIEGSDTSCVLVVPEPLARSAGGLTLALSGRAQWTGAADRSRHLSGMETTVRVVSPRRRVAGEVRFDAAATDHHTPRHRDTEVIKDPRCLGASVCREQ
jgi:hypothetical protein